MLGVNMVKLVNLEVFKSNDIFSNISLNVFNTNFFIRYVLLYGEL